MSKFKCECGAVVVHGEIVKRDNKFKFDLDSLIPKFKGTMLKNKSNNPKKWNWVCSDCQKKEVK